MPHSCCEDPLWLYRAYQDTRVDFNSLRKTIENAKINNIEVNKILQGAILIDADQNRDRIRGFSPARIDKLFFHGVPEILVEGFFKKLSIESYIKQYLYFWVIYE